MKVGWFLSIQIPSVPQRIDFKTYSGFTDGVTGQCPCSKQDCTPVPCSPDHYPRVRKRGLSGTPLPSDSRVTIDCPWHRNESMTLLPPGQRERGAGQQASSCPKRSDLGHEKAQRVSGERSPGKRRGLTGQFRRPRQRGWSRGMPPRGRCP